MSVEQINKSEVKEDVINKMSDVKELKEKVLTVKNTQDNLFDLQKNILKDTLVAFQSKTRDQLRNDHTWTFAVQTALKSITKADGKTSYLDATKIDGIYGPATRSAVAEFQKDNIITGSSGKEKYKNSGYDGLAGPETIKVLIEKLNLKNEKGENKGEKISIEEEREQSINIAKKNEEYLQKNFGKTMSIIYHNDTKKFAIYESDATLPFFAESISVDLKDKKISFLGNTLDLSKDQVSDDELFRVAALVRHRVINYKNTNGKFIATGNAGATDSIAFERLGFLKTTVFSNEYINKHIFSMGYAIKLDKFSNFLNECKKTDKKKLKEKENKNNIVDREREYLSRYQKIYDQDYNQLFSGLDNIGQGDLGDCYLISAINVLARCPYFDTLMKTSIQIGKNKKGEEVYRMIMPLGEPNGVNIDISKEEISLAKIKGNLGYKIMEIGFAKYILKQIKIGSLDYNELEKISGGISGFALQTFLGAKSLEGYTILGPKKNNVKTLNNFDQNAKISIINLLKTYDLAQGSGFITVGSIPGESHDKNYRVGDNIIYNKHAYSVLGVEKNTDGSIKYINILNPWNNNKKEGGSIMKISIDDFFGAFSTIDVAQLTNNFLNLTTEKNEITITDTTRKH